jgi:hypothetical protein
MKSVRISQVLLVAALFAGGASLSVWAAEESRRSGRLPQFYQNEFAPAAMLACGHGYRNIAWSGNEPLGSFLSLKVDSLSCHELLSHALIPLDAFQRISLYLEYSVAVAWRLLGVSWHALTVLYAILGGGVALAVFGLMRLALSPPLALAATAATVTAPLNLTYVPELRDYSKAPFMLALILIMGTIVKHASSATRLYWLMALGGVVAGVGLGFRTDVLLLLVPLVVSVLCFRKTDDTSRWHRVGVGASGLAVFAVLFVLTAWPVIKGYSRGNNTAHVALLGLSTSFDDLLGVQASHYELLPLYLDGYEEALVRDYGRRTSDDRSLFAIGTEEYDKQSYRYLGRVVATFPADVIIRAVASTIKIVDLGFSDTYAGIPVWLQRSKAARSYAFRRRAVVTVPSIGLIAAVLVAFGLLAADLRVGSFFIFITIFLAASAALQFIDRHFFYLEFLGWWVVVFAGAEAITLCSTLARRRARPAWLTVPRLLRAFIVLAGVFVVCGLAVWGARAYQQRSFDRMVSGYLNSAATELTVTTTTQREGRLLLTPALAGVDFDSSEQVAHLVHAAYLKIDLNPSSCDEVVFEATIRYTATSPAVDFTHHVKVPLANPRSVVLLVPVFPEYFVLGRDEVSSRFDGIEAEPRAAACVSAIRRVSPRNPEDVLITATVPADWSEARHYQTLSGIERRYDGKSWDTEIYSTVPRHSLTRSILDGPVESIFAQLDYRFPAVRFVGGSGIEMSDRANGPYAYLVQTTSRLRQPGRYAIAEGELFSGGLTFGLLRDRAWYQQMHIDAGRFVAVAQTLGEGSFAIVLANDNNSLITPTSFRVDRIGWADLGR